MGETIRFKCGKCGNSYDLMIGQGMRDSDLTTVKGHFDEKAVSAIESGLASEDNTDWSFRNMIGYCASCRSYLSVPTFFIINDDKKKMIAGTCKCGHIVMLINDRDTKAMESVKCPKCDHVMKYEKTGRWD